VNSCREKSEKRRDCEFGRASTRKVFLNKMVRGAKFNPRRSGDPCKEGQRMISSKLKKLGCVLIKVTRFRARARKTIDVRGSPTKTAAKSGTESFSLGQDQPKRSQNSATKNQDCLHAEVADAGTGDGILSISEVCFTYFSALGGARENAQGVERVFASERTSTQKTGPD